MRKKKRNKNKSILLNIPIDSHAMEQYKNIRANIEFLEVDKKYKIIMVTSTEAAAGKTTTSVHLAKAFAQSNEKTLLLGGDLRKPALNKYTDESNIGKGALVSTLMKKNSWEDAIIQSTESPNLYTIYAGFIPPNPSELLQSDSMKVLLETLRSNFDRIIIDAPPILPVVDSKILATYSDGLVLVVRSKFTEKEALSKVKKEIDQLPKSVKFLGTILNAVEVGKNDYYYYYY